MIRIRRATIEDEAKIFELLGQFSSSAPPGESSTYWQKGVPTFREIVQNDGMGTVLLAEEGADGVGVITLSYPVAIRCAGRYACIEEFIVSERVRGKGVGSQLLEAAIAEATSRGCDEIQCNGPSELGYPVYLRQGLKDTGRHLKMKL